MEILDGELDLDAFFARLAASPRRVLLLDYDGTLAPFREERGAAVPYPGVREAIGALDAAGHTRVVIISGRAVADLIPLLGVEPAPEVWGCHGWERRLADGTYSVGDIGDQARDALERGERALREHGLAPRTERKPVSVALHFRGLARVAVDELRRTVAAEWSGVVRSGGLEVHEFDGGLELRVPGVDKGAAVETVLSETEIEGPAAAAYLGDDLTDEDAFRAIRGRGLSVLVRHALRPTAAQLWLRPPDELLEFLRGWHRTCGG